MAGVAVTLGAAAVTSALAVGVAAVGSAAILSARASGAADAAALAAADAASGAVSGVPCEVAERVAAAGGAVVVACDLDGLVATVQVRTGAGLLAAHARARAGPPA